VLAVVDTLSVVEILSEGEVTGAVDVLWKEDVLSEVDVFRMVDVLCEEDAICKVDVLCEVDVLSLVDEMSSEPDVLIGVEELSEDVAVSSVDALALTALVIDNVLAEELLVDNLLELAEAETLEVVVKLVNGSVLDGTSELVRRASVLEDMTSVLPGILWVEVEKSELAGEGKLVLDDVFVPEVTSSLDDRDSELIGVWVVDRDKELEVDDESVLDSVSVLEDVSTLEDKSSELVVIVWVVDERTEPKEEEAEDDRASVDDELSEKVKVVEVVVNAEDETETVSEVGSRAVELASAEEEG
jgi:hypothetical protein